VVHFAACIPSILMEGPIDQMMRREFITLVGAAVAWPGAVRAQTVAKVPLIGVLAALSAVPAVEIYRKKFQQLGYVPDKTIAFMGLGAAGKLETLPALVGQMVNASVDVIIAGGYPAAFAAKAGAPTIPVVVIASGDPVATGLVNSLARPGGHVTGVSEQSTELSTKRLQVLKDAVPGMRIVAVLYNSDDLGMTLRYQAVQTVGPVLGLRVVSLPVRAPDDFEVAFSAMTEARPDAIMMVTDSVTNLNRQRIIAFAGANHLPSMFEFSAHARDGGLMSYGPNNDETFEIATALGDRILHGANPGDLPVQNPTKFDLVINLKTAKALGLTIPPSTMVQATEIIE
jgi:putative tryptophan/tyrosine transport system substrate-binding protein